MARFRKHYERIIVACAFLLLFVNVGFTSTSFSVYQAPLVALPGVGDVGGSFIVTVRTLVTLVSMFFTGVYYKHLNPRIGFFLATLCTAVAFVLFGSLQSLWGLCIASTFAGLGYGFGGMVASTYLIGNWFRGKVGSVSGTVTMGSGFAAILVPIVAGALMDMFSLSVAFYVEAAVALIIGITIFMFVRVNPMEVGREPIESYGKVRKLHKPGDSDKPKRHPKEKLSSVPLPKASYISMIIAIILLGGVSVSGYNYFGILLTSQGIDPIVAATVISVAGITLTFSKFLVGKVCDRFGTLAGCTAFFILLIGALLLCSLIGRGGVPEAFFAGAILGIGMPLGTTGISLWSLELSTPEKMLTNIRRFQLSYAFGGFAFNMMPGVLFSVTGTYTSTYDVLTLMAAICAVIVITVYSHHIIRARKAYERLHGASASEAGERLPDDEKPDGQDGEDLGEEVVETGVELVEEEIEEVP